MIPGAGGHWSEEAFIRKVEVLNGANVQGLEQYEEEWSIAGGTPKSTTSAASFSFPDVPVSRTGTQESSDCPVAVLQNGRVCGIRRRSEHRVWVICHCRGGPLNDHNAMVF